MTTRSRKEFENVDSPAPAEPVNVEATKRHGKTKGGVKIADDEDDRPSPIQFDEFITWACTQWDIEKIRISRKIQEEYIPIAKRKYPPKVKNRGKSILSTSLSLIDTGSTILEPRPSTSMISSKLATNVFSPPKSISIPKWIASSKSVNPLRKDIKSFLKIKSTDNLKKKGRKDKKPEPSIPLTTIYNTSGKIVEISIINCKQILPQKFIKLINVALPFHKSLNKITIRKGGLTQGVIYEIKNMLPYSNITEICLDDNYVKQGNYYILLDELSSLKILSLCRCSINEVVCEDIVRRLEPGHPGDKLLSLSLSTNFIGDKGAIKFGDLLRRNRNLLYLNLAHNEITNEGAAAILESLKDFKLNEGDLLKKINKKMAYEKKKMNAYEIILRDMEAAAAESRRKSAITTTSFKRKTITIAKKDYKDVRSAQQDLPSVYELALSKAMQVVGEFEDIFDAKNTVEKNNKLYCIGNVRLCYLNLAYNNLDDRILKTLLQVLTYQATLPMPTVYTGLLRLVIEGNPFSENNVDLLIIQVLLTKILPDRKLRPPSTFASRRLRSMLSEKG